MSAAAALRERSHPATWQPPEIDPADVDVLARLLDDAAGEDALVLATALLGGSGGLAALPSLSRSQLLAAGLSMAQAARLKAALGLGARVAAAIPHGRALDRAGATALLRPLLTPLDREELHALFLGADGTLRGRQCLARGGYTAVVIHPREVLAPALEARADGLVLAHNHPSGRSAPSPEDVSFTSRLEAAAEIVGLRLVDHLVFAADGVASAMPAGAHWRVRAPHRLV